MEELWKSIPTYDGYEASNLGNIRIHKNGEYFYPKHFDDGRGYFRVSTAYGTIRIHRLICMAFYPNSENKTDVNHKDGNKKNNNAENLEWCTRSENIKHAFATGLKPRLYGERNPNYHRDFSPEHRARLSASNKGKQAGEKHHNAKYTKEQVLQILLKFKETQMGAKRLHRYYFPDLPHTFIHGIIKGRAWKHISDKFWTEQNF